MKRSFKLDKFLIRKQNLNYLFLGFQEEEVAHVEPASSFEQFDG